MVVVWWCWCYVGVVCWCGGGVVVVVLPAMAGDVSVDGGLVEVIGGEHGQGDVGVLMGGKRGEQVEMSIEHFFWGLIISNYNTLNLI